MLQIQTPTSALVSVSQTSTCRHCNVLTKTCLLVEFKGFTKAWMTPCDKRLRWMLSCPAMSQIAEAELATIAGLPPLS